MGESVVAAMAAVSLVAGASPAAAAPERVEWSSRGDAFYVAQEGELCRAIGLLDRAGGEILLAVDYVGDRVTLTIVGEVWTKAGGGEFEGVYDFIGTGMEWTADVEPMTASFGSGYIAEFDPQVLDDFAKANSLTLWRENRRLVSLPLNGSARAAAALRGCRASVSD